ncbi:hypothetical protein [Methylopila sp. M107]|uniref:hypothetical protein n=1 Tax=Methylopila sp. M107 TaxID=1101190 RepID=UPI0003809BED|nr:hypothetical protein [Methylopila sp. M107]
MTLRPAAIVFCAALLIHCSAASADQVGAAVVDGRIVILNSDNTWAYADAQKQSAAGCDRFPGVELCVKDLGWASVDKVGAFQALYRVGSQYYFGLVREPYGAKAGVTLQALRSAIVQNAALAAKTTVDKVPVLEVSTEVAGIPQAEAVTYTVQMSGLPLIYRNIFRVKDDESMQIVFWSVGTTISPEFKAKIDDTVAKIKID